MLSSYIPLLERFGTSFTIMSYFGKTHRSFLLLSKLSRQSRSMLDQNLEEFLNSMIGNNTCLKIDEENKEALSLPWSLFGYKISFPTETNLDLLIKIIENIHNKIGYYFNGHFINQRLCFNGSISFRTNVVEKLYQNLELIKKTEVISYMDNYALIYYIIKHIFNLAIM